MHHLFEVADPECIEAVTEPIFDGFDVVIDPGVDCGNGGCLIGAEGFVERAQGVDLGGLEVGDGHDWARFAEHDQVFDFDADAIAHQCTLGEIPSQDCDVCVVAPVEW